MEMPIVVSARRFHEFDESQKEELFQTLLTFTSAVDELPRKSLRKILEVSLAVLQYKGQQLKEVQSKIKKTSTSRDSEPSDESFQISRLSEENARLKRLLDKLESDNGQFEAKNKELTNELAYLQKRLQEAAPSAEPSDKESDPLSELDKQEELLKNINRKNKHIKRLLKEIETLQQQNIEQSKSLITTEQALNEAKGKINHLNAEISAMDKERHTLKEKVNEMKLETSRLEATIAYIEDERESGDKKYKTFIDKLDEQVQSWKKKVEEKDVEIKDLSEQLEKIKAEISNQDQDPKIEIKHLKNAISSRDKFIEQLEQRIKVMAEEMLTSTNLMNQMSAEKIDERDPAKPRPCCKTIEESLVAATQRCKELSDMLDRAEEDNMLRSREAAMAVAQLDAYHRGEDGLKMALNRCITLEYKLRARQKHIKTLITELNTMNEIIQENKLLRKRLNIGEDVVIVTRSLTAKDRNKDKIIERLNLKLRASEESRLQLKLEKCDLKRELLKVQNSVPSKSNAAETEECRNIRIPSEYGEVEDSVHSNGTAEDRPPIQPTTRTYSIDYAAKCQDLIQENETLRLGMHEILDHLRDYSASSEHITINTELLHNLLRTLQDSTNFPVKSRLHKELEELKQREEALRELLNKEAREEGEVQDDDADDGNQVEEATEATEAIEVIEEPRVTAAAVETENISFDLPEVIDTSTRPTTPNRDINDSLLPIIAGELNTKHTSKERQLKTEIDELKVYKQHYEDLSESLMYPDDDIKSCYSKLDAKIVQLELALKRQSSINKYLQEDFDHSLTLQKQSELNLIQQITDLSFELSEEKLKCERLEIDLKNIRSAGTYTDSEYCDLMKSNGILTAQLAFLVEGAVNEKFLPEICVDYGVIRENLQLDYITIEEYEAYKRNLNLISEKEIEMDYKVKQLENLLDIAQNQIQSQQKLLNEVTDNHIHLRHMVADLQSTSEDKLLIAKIQRDLQSAKTELSSMKYSYDKLSQQYESLKCLQQKEQQSITDLKKGFQDDLNDKTLKIRFLQKSLFILKQKYSKYTPMVVLTNYLCAYKTFIKNCQLAEKTPVPKHILQYLDAFIKTKIDYDSKDKAQNLIKLIKAETQSRLVEESYQSLEAKYKQVQEELSDLRIRYAFEKEHWQTIEVLFGTDIIDDSQSNSSMNEMAAGGDVPVPAKRRLSKGKKNGEAGEKKTSAKASKQVKQYNEMGVQVCLDETRIGNEQDQANTRKVASQAVQTEHSYVHSEENIHQLRNQLKSAQIKTEEDASLLSTLKNEISETKTRIKDLQEKLEASERRAQSARNDYEGHQAGIIEKTIYSFHTLLSEKDKSINKYQDLLQSERNQNDASIKQLDEEIDSLKVTINSLDNSLKSKDEEIKELKTRLETMTARCNSLEKRQIVARECVDVDENGDQILHEITDEKLEEMFEQESPEVPTITEVVEVFDDQTAEDQPSLNPMQLRDREKTKEVQNLLKQIKELKDKIVFLEKSIKTKDDELQLSKEKLQLLEEREKSVENTNTPEIENLRGLLEEKDKHINDLMETLNNFHDDQRNFIADSSTFSADQISKLASDLNRTEATNKIYHTQVEALRRQLTTLSAREKQARELNQSLRNQLIKRPVVSIKTELNTRAKNENLQKRIGQLEQELEDARNQLQRQQVMIDAKRARSASEIGLWEKQKRWQQNAEKYKAKLEETESTLEKNRALLQSARNTISRLEKDKQNLENRLSKINQNQLHHDQPPLHNLKCCRTPSCPNLQPPPCQNANTVVKYSPSESPETYTGPSSECSSPVRGAASLAEPSHSALTFFADNQSELIEALKARIEMQQRKIIAMELEGKGSNALTTELEKLHERQSALEAQNIRLEAKNLQLQLDNDMLRQSDATDRLQKRIKYLEDYIIALKEERAILEAERDICKCSSGKASSSHEQGADQTILTLRRIVEKLKVENKYLKESRRSSEARILSETTTTDVTKLQKLYGEALDKITALQIELNIKSKCPNCGNRGRSDNQSEQVRYIKEQLIRKSQLLQKAKLLLTRAAAKEKVLKEQIGVWKRKCSELQNVPVIDEISE